MWIPFPRIDPAQNRRRGTAGTLGHAAVEFSRTADPPGHQRRTDSGDRRFHYRAYGGVGSELATHNWLMKQSALGELLEVDYESLSLMTMYRAADALWKHSTQIEQTLFTRITDLFGFSTTITLYDLTNTYFEGEVPHNTKARRGRSKETSPERRRRERTDCPLVTLGLVLDGSGPST